MSRNIGEALHLPSPRALQVGALSFLAALSMHPSRLNDTGHQAYSPAPMEQLLGDGAGATTPAPGPTSEEQPGQSQETQLQQGVPSVVQKYIDNNAVVISALRCSGGLVKSPQGVPVGALTAGHCLLDEGAREINTYVKGSDGREYLVSNNPVELQTGVDVTDLQTVGKVNEFVVPPKGSGIDQAFAVLPGHTLQQVLRDYRRSQLSPLQIASLKTNEAKIWLAGYPYTQNGDDAGNMIRQEFSTTYIGQDVNLNVDNTLTNVLDATAVTDSNGATCTWGLSGGEAMVVRNVHTGEGRKQVVRSVGNFSFFSLFSALKEKGGSEQSYSEKDAKASIRYYHQYFPWVNLKGVDAICGYVNQEIGKKYNIIHVAPSLNDVPGH